MNFIPFSSSSSIAILFSLLFKIIRPPANDIVASVMMVCAVYIAVVSKHREPLLLLQLSGMTSGNSAANAGLFRCFIVSVCVVSGTW